MLVVAVCLVYTDPPLIGVGVPTVTVARHSGAGGAEGRGDAPRSMSPQEACTQVEHLRQVRHEARHHFCSHAAKTHKYLCCMLILKVLQQLYLFIYFKADNF